MTETAGAGGGPLRSESARLPSVTLALAAPGPPVQLRWTTLRVQGPTLRDAALANDGDGSPPVAPRLLHRPLPESCQLPSDLEQSPTEALCEICDHKVWHATQTVPAGHLLLNHQASARLPLSLRRRIGLGRSQRPGPRHRCGVRRIRSDLVLKSLAVPLQSRSPEPDSRCPVVEE